MPLFVLGIATLASANDIVVDQTAPVYRRDPSMVVADGYFPQIAESSGRVLDRVVLALEQQRDALAACTAGLDYEVRGTFQIGTGGVVPGSFDPTYIMTDGSEMPSVRQKCFRWGIESAQVVPPLPSEVGTIIVRFSYAHIIAD